MTDVESFQATTRMLLVTVIYRSVIYFKCGLIIYFLIYIFLYVNAAVLLLHVFRTSKYFKRLSLHVMDKCPFLASSTHDAFF